MTEHVSGRRIVAGGLAGVALGAAALIGVFPGAAGATGGPDHDDGGGAPPGMPEHPCPEDGWDFHWGPDDQEDVPGAHTDGDFTVTIDNVRHEEDRTRFDFETSQPVELLFAVGWPDRDQGETFNYDPPVTTGTGHTGDPEYIKHVYFCPGEVDDTTTTTVDDTTTTTVDDTTTTTVDDTTTTTAPPTSEEPPPSTEPTTPSSEAPPTTEAPTPTTVPASDEELPQTGSTTMPLVAGAAALVAVGVALVTGRRFLNGRSAS